MELYTHLKRQWEGMYTTEIPDKLQKGFSQYNIEEYRPVYVLCKSKKKKEEKYLVLYRWEDKHDKERGGYAVYEAIMEGAGYTLKRWKEFLHGNKKIFDKVMEDRGMKVILYIGSEMEPLGTEHHFFAKKDTEVDLYEVVIKGLRDGQRLKYVEHGIKKVTV